MYNISDAAVCFLIITFLFMVGSMLGWTIELFFRKFISKNNPERKWINPGLMVGPCLPIYGFGLVALFLMSLIPYLSLNQDDELTWSHILLTILAMGIIMTVIEYIAGLVFIKKMHVKLWDYSGLWGNVQGIICPQFSLYWTILSAVFYFFVQPYVIKLILWFSENIAFSFVVGMFYGILLIDLSYSMNLVTKVRAFAKENEIVIAYEELKKEIRQDTDELKKRWRFLLALNSHEPLLAQLEKSIDKIKVGEAKKKR